MGDGTLNHHFGSLFKHYITAIYTDSGKVNAISKNINQNLDSKLQILKLENELPLSLFFIFFDDS